MKVMGDNVYCVSDIYIGYLYNLCSKSSVYNPNKDLLNFSINCRESLQIGEPW